MRAVLIAAMAWTAGARALDVVIPKDAKHETQSCTIAIKGAIYSSNSQFEGAIPGSGTLLLDRYTWNDGDIEYVFTKGERRGDGKAEIESFTKRESVRSGDIESESLQTSSQSKNAGAVDSRSSYERNEYQVDDKNKADVTKTLQGRVVNNTENVSVRETINTRETATGRIVTTTIKGPYTQKLSDVTGQYATIESKVTTCTIERPGQS